jgi:hypothetical protein
MSLEDFNLYVFRGLLGEFKDLVMSLITKAEPLLYIDLHSHLLTHEFLNKNSFHSMDVTPSLQSSSLPQQPPLLSTRNPLLILLCLITAQISIVTRVVPVATGVPTTPATTTS